MFIVRYFYFWKYKYIEFCFQELVKTPEVARDYHLHSAGAFAFSNLLRYAHSDYKTLHNRYPVHTYGPLASKDHSAEETYIPHFSQKLREAIRKQDSRNIQLFIRVLGNIAHPAIVPVFEPYLEGKEPLTEFQRTLMVVSLNKLASIKPKLARSVLYKIYVNLQEPYQVRVAAVYNLMKTNPPMSMLQRMAQASHNDVSNNVRSAIKTSIESAAQLVGDRYHER